MDNSPHRTSYGEACDQRAELENQLKSAAKETQPALRKAIKKAQQQERQLLKKCLEANNPHHKKLVAASKSRGILQGTLAKLDQTLKKAAQRRTLSKAKAEK